MSFVRLSFVILPSFVLPFVILSFVILSFVIPVMGHSQGAWERVTVPTTHNLHAVCFVDSLFGWAAGDSGTILHTSDGSVTWTHQPSGIANEIMALYFLDRERGWAAAFNFTVTPYGSILLRTTDGGISWTHEPYPQENIFINCIHYFDTLTGWMGGSPHALVKTTDGGLSWNQAAIDTSVLAFFPVLNLAFLNPQVGYATGGMFDIAGVIWRTTNGGDLWYAIDPSQAPADEVHGLHIFDELRAIGSGGDPDYGYGVGMIRTTDGGLNWNYGDIGVQGIAFDIDFRTSSQAWCPLGPQRKLIFSSDTGNTWTEHYTPDSVSLFAITFPDSLHGYGVGSEGAVVRFIPPVQPGMPPNPSVPEVLRVYPNPAKGITNYELRITNHEFVSIELFSLFGKEFERPFSGELVPGVHTVPFDVSRIAPGLYFYRLLLNGDLKATGKLVVH